MNPQQKKPKAYSYVRFSTPEQGKGDSLRRQSEAAAAYAAKHGLTLDDTLKPDAGLSAYSGKHRAKGALGQFLKAVEGGRVPRGSMLIVESFDRLSREEVLDAVALFMQIINAGIRVVTLQDGQEYTRESVNANFGQLIVSITIMSRAHEESAAKAKRLCEAWAQKREMIDTGVPLTARAPAWLALPARMPNAPRDDSRRFSVIKERARTIQQIYRMRLEGKGAGLIEKELNRGRPPWTPKNGWRKSYIVKILKNPAVIGEFQLHKLVEGKRVPVGEPVCNYFPSIVDQKTFYAVQALRSDCRKGGPVGKAHNLFVHLVKCGFCGGPMHLIDKWDSPNGGKRLICDNAHRRRGCEYHGIRYDEVQDLVLNYCRGLRVADVLPKQGEYRAKAAALRDTLAGAEGQLADLGKRINNLTEQIAISANQKTRTLLEKKLAEYVDTEAKVRRDREQTERQLADLMRATDDAAERVKSLKDLHDKLRGDGEGSLDLRLRLRAELRRLIKRIIVYPVAVPVASKPHDPERFEPHDAEQGEELRRLAAHPKQNRAHRYLKVYFHGGGFRVLTPGGKRPLALNVVGFHTDIQDDINRHGQRQEDGAESKGEL